ncbi:7 transmembrane helices usually fused to an inactive transglutaminase family protein, partial [Vibrio parahaemolyticus AQ3810]
LVLWASY